MDFPSEVQEKILKNCSQVDVARYGLVSKAAFQLVYVCEDSVREQLNREVQPSVKEAGRRGSPGFILHYGTDHDKIPLLVRRSVSLTDAGHCCLHLHPEYHIHHFSRVLDMPLESIQAFVEELRGMITAPAPTLPPAPVPPSSLSDRATNAAAAASVALTNAGLQIAAGNFVSRDANRLASILMRQECTQHQLQSYVFPPQHDQLQMLLEGDILAKTCAAAILAEFELVMRFVEICELPLSQQAVLLLALKKDLYRISLRV